MGILILHNMMSGQVLSNTSPLIAITYQISIMPGVVGSASFSFSGLILVEWSYCTFFDIDTQLVLSLTESSENTRKETHTRLPAPHKQRDAKLTRFPP